MAWRSREERLQGGSGAKVDRLPTGHGRPSVCHVSQELASRAATEAKDSGYKAAPVKAAVEEDDEDDEEDEDEDDEDEDEDEDEDAEEVWIIEDHRESSFLLYHQHDSDIGRPDLTWALSCCHCVMAVQVDQEEMEKQGKREKVRF